MPAFRFPLCPMLLGAVLLLGGGVGCTALPWKHAVTGKQLSEAGDPFPDQPDHIDNPAEISGVPATAALEQERETGDTTDFADGAVHSVTGSAIMTVLRGTGGREHADGRKPLEPPDAIVRDESYSDRDAAVPLANIESLTTSPTEETPLETVLATDRWMRNHTPRSAETEALVKAFERKQLDPYAHLNNAKQSDADAAKRSQEYANNVLSPFRWYHHELDAWEAALTGVERPVPGGKPRESLAVPNLRGDERVQLALLLFDERPVLRANAAILSARLVEHASNRSFADASSPAGHPEPSVGAMPSKSMVQALADTVADPSLSAPQRAAAVEMLARLPDVDVVFLRDTAREIDEVSGSGHAGSGLTAKRLREQLLPLRVELLHALAGRMKPWDDALFRLSLNDPEKEIRLETLRLWRNHPPPSASAPESGKANRDTETTSHELPGEVAALARTETDPRVYGEVLTTLAVWKHPEALRNIRIALENQNASIKFAAVDALGLLGGPEATEYLYARYSDVSPQIRLRVVRALRLLGEEDAVYRKANDKALEVRREVVALIGDRPTPKTAELARKMLGDPSNEIVRAALRAVASWPIETVGPMLLDLMENESPIIRALASAALAERWAPASGFEHRDLPQYRAEALASLRQEFERFAASRTCDHGGVEDGTQDGVSGNDSQATARSPSANETGRGIELVGLTVAEASSGTTSARSESRRVVAALADLESTAPPLRRSAAVELNAEARQLPLSRDAVLRLGTLAELETDPFVLANLFEALSASALDPLDSPVRKTLLRCAVAGRSHASMEVRKKAARLAATTGTDEAVAVLLPFLEDPNAEVVRAALVALQDIAEEIERGSRRPETLEALLALRRNPSSPVRIDAALLLYRLGEPTGREMLIRLVRSRDDSVRLYAATRLAETGERVFVPEMIRFLDDNGGIRRIALDALPRMVGRDFGESDNRFTAEGDSARDRAERWKAWAAREGNVP